MLGGVIAAVLTAVALAIFAPAVAADPVPLGQYGTGTAGGAAGELAGPSGVATDSEGNVFVADRLNHRISVFAPAGAFLRAFGFDVIPGGTAGLEVCTTDCQAGVPGGDAGQLNLPGAVEPDVAGNLYIADDNNRISVFTTGGEFVRAFGFDVIPGLPAQPEVCTTATTCKSGVGGGDAGQLQFPTGLALDPAGNLHVVEFGNQRISAFTAEGDFIRASGFDVIPGVPTEFEICTTSCKLGAFGGGAGQLASPHGIAVDQGNVYVADFSNSRMSVFSAFAGAFAGAFGFDVIPGGATGFELCTTSCKAGVAGGAAGQLDDPVGVTTDAAGNILVAEEDNHRLAIFDNQGAFLSAFGFDVDPGGATGFEVCTTTCKVGASGTAAGQFNEPYDAAVDCRGAIYVVELVNNRVQRFGEPGTPLPPCTAGPATPPATPKTPPSNDFTIGKLKRNTKKGTAKLTVTVDSAPGELALAGRKAKSATAAATTAGDVNVAVRAKGKAKQKLAEAGKVKLALQVTYTPSGGTSNTKSTMATLKRKR